ncbi:MAG: hypothetical protein Q9216_005794 [Gyalolechia sp. 2 TL-2023]
MSEHASPRCQLQVDEISSLQEHPKSAKDRRGTTTVAFHQHYLHDESSYKVHTHSDCCCSTSGRAAGKSSGLFQIRPVAQVIPDREHPGGLPVFETCFDIKIEIDGWKVLAEGATGFNRAGKSAMKVWVSELYCKCGSSWKNGVDYIRHGVGVMEMDEIENRLPVGSSK